MIVHFWLTCSATMHCWLTCTAIVHFWLTCCAIVHCWLTCSANVHFWLTCTVIVNFWLTYNVIVHFWLTCTAIVHFWPTCTGIVHFWLTWSTVQDSWVPPPGASANDDVISDKQSLTLKNLSQYHGAGIFGCEPLNRVLGALSSITYILLLLSARWECIWWKKVVTFICTVSICSHQTMLAPCYWLKFINPKNHDWHITVYMNQHLCQTNTIDTYTHFNKCNIGSSSLNHIFNILKCMCIMNTFPNYEIVWFAHIFTKSNDTGIGFEHSKSI